MVDQEQARKILQERLADNLVIVTEFENPKEWCFDLGLRVEFYSNELKIRGIYGT